MTSDGLSYLYRAASAEFGIVLSLSNEGYAKFLRRRLYHVREQERRRGNDTFDGLSIIVRERNLLILRRDQVPRMELGTNLQSREIHADEMPDQIRARGRSRFTFHRIS